MARVFGLWWGGHSYSRGYFDDDMESWASLKDAKRSLVARYESRYPDRMSRRVMFTDGLATLGEVPGLETPVVGPESTIVIYFGESDCGKHWRVYSEPSLRLSLSFYERKNCDCDRCGGRYPHEWREPKLRGVKVERY